MSVNRHREHVLVLPEDDANRALVNGFLLHPSVQLTRVQPLNVAGGWAAAQDSVATNLAAGMRRYPYRYTVLLIDFDADVERRRLRMRENVPPDLQNRVFMLGCLHEPETLRRTMDKSLEDIGRSLAEACRTDQDGDWSHAHLAHNQPELARLRQMVRPFLFS
jgi:hypothetical protein